MQTLYFLFIVVGAIFIGLVIGARLRIKKDWREEKEERRK